MIDYKSKYGDVKLVATGSDADLFADTVILIQRIYAHLKMVDDKMAEHYKDEIIWVLSDPSSPFYKEDRK